MADPVAQVSGIPVGRVDHRVQAQASAEGHRLGPSQPEQRVAGTDPHGGQSVDPGPPQQVGQDRLGLVVHGVTGGRTGTEHLATGPAGPVLEVGAVADIHPLRSEGGSEASGGTGHDPGLGRRSGAQPVVDVDRRDRAAGRHSQDQEGQGVGATGHPAHQLGPRRREGAPLQQGGGEGVALRAARRADGRISPRGPGRYRHGRSRPTGCGSRSARAATPAPARPGRAARARPSPPLRR